MELVLSERRRRALISWGLVTGEGQPALPPIPLPSPTPATWERVESSHSVSGACFLLHLLLCAVYSSTRSTVTRTNI